MGKKYTLGRESEHPKPGKQHIQSPGGMEDKKLTGKKLSLA